MTIEYRPATVGDAELLVGIYNAAFYDDFLKYGECPGYGKTKEMMEKSIENFPKFVILCDREPVGCVSCKNSGRKVYEIGCLCVIPKFQGKGIGTHAVEFVKTYYEDWEKLTAVTPADKTENIRFYTEKCGFHVVSVEKSGKVVLARLVAEK